MGSRSFDGSCVYVGMRTTRSQVHQEPTYSTENDSDSAESGGSASSDKSSSDDMPGPDAAVSPQVGLLCLFARITLPPGTALPLP